MRLLGLVASLQTTIFTLPDIDRLISFYLKPSAGGVDSILLSLLPSRRSFQMIHTSSSLFHQKYCKSLLEHLTPPSHLTELVCQSEIITPPCQQQPTSSAELKVSPEPSNPLAQEQVSAYISHTGMQNVKQLFNNVII